MKISKILRKLAKDATTFEEHVVKDQKELEGLFSIKDEKAVVYISLQENKYQSWMAPAGFKRGAEKDIREVKYEKKDIVKRQYDIYIKSREFHHYAGSSLDFDKEEISNFIHLRMDEGKKDLNKAVARFRLRKMI
jgi:hypothetical protein